MKHSRGSTFSHLIDKLYGLSKKWWMVSYRKSKTHMQKEKKPRVNANEINKYSNCGNTWTCIQAQ
jgi:hypothetical protein